MRWSRTGRRTIPTTPTSRRQAGQPSPSEAAGCGARFNFTVDDPDELWERVKGSATVVESLFDTPYGTRKFTIADPDGNELGFVRDG